MNRIGPPEIATSNADDPRRLKVHREPPKRDVPYVPTDEPVVAAMLRFAGVTERDVVYDLGCGDGRIVTAAAKLCGARGVGVDIDPQRIHEARERARNAHVSDRAKFLCQSFFDTDLREATVVMLYLLPSINVQLRPKMLWELAPGSRIIANYFDMGDWEPDMKAEAHHRTLMQWIVPAWVGGSWKCLVNDPTGRWHFTLNLRRRYQNVTGTIRLNRKERPIAEGKLFGDRLTFRVYNDITGQNMRYACHVDGKHLRGTIQRDAIEGPVIGWGGSQISAPPAKSEVEP